MPYRVFHREVPCEVGCLVRWCNGKMALFSGVFFRYYRKIEPLNNDESGEMT